MPLFEQVQEIAVVPISKNHPLIVKVDVHSPSKESILAFDLKMKGNVKRKVSYPMGRRMPPTTEFIFPSS